jgi:hypothetical protein
MAENIIQFPYNKKKVNNQQYRIITEDINNSICAISCVGSGKTTTLTSRVAHMIYKLDCNPKDFFIATFTRNAAKDMTRKINNLIGVSQIMCGTFHSLGMKALNTYDYEFIDNEYNIDEIQYIFYNFLKSDKSRKFKEKIKYIFIDEFQDINDIQFKIIKELYNNSKSINIFGDDCQNIYNFRGSNISYILNIEKYFPEIIINKLIINYRCSKSIVNLANESIKKNKNQLEKKMISNNQEKSKPKVLRFKNFYEEMKYITNSIKRDINELKIKPEKIAILCRNNQPLFYIEEMLMSIDINSIFISSEHRSDNLIKTGCVIISTIHSSKGLEWYKVYLIGMNDTFFPSIKNISNIDEERRLFYVAITRCKEQLVMTYNKTNLVSRFLTEVNKNLFNKNFEFDDNTLTDDNDLYLLKEEGPTISVTGLIKKLNGNDYIELKKICKLNDLEINTKKVYSPYEYPDFIKKNEYYSDFGCFVDYLIRRMIADKNILNKRIFTKGYHDNRADKVIISVFLNKYKRMIYNEYKQLFILLKRYYNSKEELITKIDIKNISKKSNIKLKKSDIEVIYEIIDSIIKKSRVFKVPIEYVKVVDKLYLPFNFINIMNKYYKNYINKKNKWSDIIYDIFNISKCHNIMSNRRKNLYTKINKDDILSLNEWYKDIYKFVDKYFFNDKKDRMIYCNPSLSNDFISGDGDLIVDTTLIDFKNSNYTNMNIEYLLQLLIYTQLAREKGYKIEYITIFNPLKGILHHYNIKDWNKGEELLSYIYSKID